MSIVYVPSAAKAPAVFVPSQTFGAGLITPELEYNDLIMLPLEDSILMDAFTDSEKAMSMAVVVARPDSGVADGYRVSCEIV